MVRYGILGAGKIARRFADSLRLEGDELYAISGRNEEKPLPGNIHVRRSTFLMKN